MSLNDAYGPVVAGIDGSKAAINAALWAIDEALSRNVSLHLVNVASAQPESGEQVLEAAHAAVNATGRSVRIETITRTGDVVAEFVAESTGASLICVGSDGVGRVARRLFGSTAVALSTRAHCPIAVIRSIDDVISDTDRIAVVVDAEPGNDAVVQYAFGEARLRGAALLALGAWRWDLGAMPYEALDQRMSAWRSRYPDVQVSMRAARKSVVAALADEYAHVGLVVIGDASDDQVAGLIGPQIRTAVAHPDCSVLVVHPSRRWRGGPRWFGY